jgi:hypothetical protein
LEADTLLAIFAAFMTQDDKFFVDNQEYLAKFIVAIQGVKPFELSCDFLMDDEKDKIKDLVTRVESNGDSQKELLTKIKARFTKVCDI